MPPYRKVLIVGHCGADTASLTWLVGQVAPSAPAYYVGSDTELKKHLDGSALVLINRALEGGFEAHDGIGLIRALKAQGTDAGLMLISNYPDAQAAAKALGALEGFGKSALSSSSVKARLTELLAG